jgi:hypothetical protein
MDGFALEWEKSLSMVELVVVVVKDRGCAITAKWSLVVR